jgi:hypothetical protein
VVEFPLGHHTVAKGKAKHSSALFGSAVNVRWLFEKVKSQTKEWAFKEVVSQKQLPLSLFFRAGVGCFL